MVLGLSGALWQGYSSKEAALNDYFNTRAGGLVRIIRNPGDMDKQFGHPNDAEDLPID